MLGHFVGKIVAGTDAERPAENVRRLTLRTRREDFDAVDGFDEQFFVYYEEVDFGVSMRKKLNRTHYMVDYPTIWHMGGATMSAEGMNASERLVESRVKFEAKWGKTMNELHEELAHESPPVRNWNSHYANWVK